MFEYEKETTIGDVSSMPYVTPEQQDRLNESTLRDVVIRLDQSLADFIISFRYLYDGNEFLDDAMNSTSVMCDLFQTVRQLGEGMHSGNLTRVVDKTEVVAGPPPKPMINFTAESMWYPN